MDDVAPSWSADGKKLAFIRLQGARSTPLVEIWSNGTRTPLAAKLFPGAYPSEAVWSSDGRHLAVSAMLASSGLYSTWVVTGASATRLVNGARPAWRPNSEALAVVSGLPLNPKLALVDTLTAKVKSVGPAAEFGYPSWSSDGRYVAMTSETDNFDMVIYDGRTGKVVDRQDIAEYPLFVPGTDNLAVQSITGVTERSPSGKKLVSVESHHGFPVAYGPKGSFLVYQQGETQQGPLLWVWVRKTHTRRMLGVTNVSRDAPSASVSADGQIAFVLRGHCGKDEIALASATSTKIALLTDNCP